MLLYMINRLKRAPISASAVLLFAAVISVIICSLHTSIEAEINNYQLTYHTIPVELTVTNLSATRTDDLEAPEWVLDVFTGKNNVTHNFSGYVKDIQLKSTYLIDAVNEVDCEFPLVGITSISCAKQLLPENGCQITWQEGYSEAIFPGNEMLCLVPYDLLSLVDQETQTLTMDFSYTIYHGITEEKWEVCEYQCTFLVAGAYLGGDGMSVYCPYPSIETIYDGLCKELKIDSIRATLVDNDLLDEFRNISASWFAEPNPLGEKTAWGTYGYEYYPYALSIDDTLLVKTAAALENSIAINQICTFIVFVLSAAAGFMIGFLMVRSRKKEIALMRTMGTPNRSVYFGFALEQMLCVTLGIALGGAYNLWQPAARLVILAATYFVGLTVALLIFLRKNLLTTIKEDE